MEEKIDLRAQMMGTAKIPTAIIRLAIPAIISMVVMAIYNMADTYFVSISPEGYLGTAAVSVFMPIMLTTQALSILFAAGGAAYLSCWAPRSLKRRGKPRQRRSRSRF